MKTGLETLRRSSAAKVAAILGQGHPPFGSGESVQCDLVSCEACWRSWLETGKPPVSKEKH